MVALQPPRLVTLNVTTKCTAACRYCHYWYTRKERTTDWSTLVEYVSSAAALGTRAIRISGGEPLTRSDLPQLVELIDEAGMVSMVCTSARHDASDLIALVEAGLDIMAISIDLLDAERFKKLRGYDIEPVLAHLDTLAALRNEAGFEIIISTVLTRANVDSMEPMLALVREKDLLLNVTPFQAGGIKESFLKGIGFSANDRPLIEEAVAQLKDSARQGIRLLNSDPFLDGFADFMIDGTLPEGHVCTAGEKEAIITVDGQLKLCHSLDPLRGTSLETQWHSRQAEKIRQQMRKLACPGCWLSCHADERRPISHTYASKDRINIL